MGPEPWDDDMAFDEREGDQDGAESGSDLDDGFYDPYPDND